MDKYPEIEKYYRYIIRDAEFIPSSEKAIEYISKFVISTSVQEGKQQSFTWQLIENELFPHMGASATIKEKACFLGNIK